MMASNSQTGLHTPGSMPQPVHNPNLIAAQDFQQQRAMQQQRIAAMQNGMGNGMNGNINPPQLTPPEQQQQFLQQQMQRRMMIQQQNHGFWARKNAVSRLQQSGPSVSKPSVMSPSSRKQSGTTSRITRGPITKLKRNRDSTSRQPRPPLQSTNSRDMERPDVVFTPLPDASSLSKFPVHPGNLSFTSRTQNNSPYLRRHGTVSGSVEVDRTISKDNTGGEAARLASLLAKFGASRKPDMRRHHIPNKRAGLDGTPYNSNTTPAADSARDSEPPMSATPMTSLVSDNVLDDFDFDSFLHEDGDNEAFVDFNTGSFGMEGSNDDGVE
ncbi:hypothetical protein LX32DRAFT_257868 [Colletotrichum zoysiae]|uniref:SOM1 protein n=1 Tax=Colletotrichum zoysiae TaxID=1216348 RepID=A0AAD9HNY1_9PEZI|nr:hypothetical protein LX32DRAFT_257868 [Colletotrichum zoysiae]